MYETGLAHPATRPSTAQPSQPKFQQQRSPAARQPATHPWLCSLVAETSFRPSPTSNPPQPSLPSRGPGASQRMPATKPAPSSPAGSAQRAKVAGATLSSTGAVSGSSLSITGAASVGLLSSATGITAALSHGQRRELHHGGRRARVWPQVIQQAQPLRRLKVCQPVYQSWAEQPSKKCVSWQAASHVKWRCPNTQSWSWLFSDTNYCSPFYGGQAPLKMLIPRKRSFFSEIVLVLDFKPSDQDGFRTSN